MSLALGALPAPVQWGVDQLREAMRGLVARAEVQRVRISETNAGVIALDQKANAVTDPRKRAEIKAAVKKAYDAQVVAATRYREFTAKFAELARQAQQWMDAHGLRESLPALSGLGLPIAVPVVVIGIYLTAVTIVGWLEKQTAVNKLQVESKLRLVDAYIDGRMTTEQFRTADASLDSTLDRTRPGDPFGFDALGKALIPIGLLVVAAFVIPPLLESARSQRRPA